jgi:nitroreductase
VRVFDVIKGRRSIRKFEKRLIEKKILHKLVEAGVWPLQEEMCKLGYS